MAAIRANIPASPGHMIHVHRGTCGHQPRRPGDGRQVGWGSKSQSQVTVRLARSVYSTCVRHVGEVWTVG